LVARQFPGNQIDLKEAEARFLKPAFFGDEIELSVNLSAETFEATWTNAASGEALTKSKGTLRVTATSASDAKDDRDSMVSLALDENVLTVEQLEQRSECFPLAVSRATARRYEQLLGAPEGSAGPSLLATLLLSTMIGMRLPGRYATF